MSQFLRPDSNITQTDFTGGFSAIDEATPSDADFAWGANNTAAVLEVGLGNPSGTPGSGTSTVRYRIAKTNNGTVDGAGNAVTVTGEVYEGAALIAADSARTATGTWTEYSFTFAASLVTDWANLRFRATTSNSGGNPSNRRGGAVSWVELEAPDASAPVTASPGAGVLAAAGLAATVALTAHQLVTAGLAALTVTAAAPTVSVTAHQTVTPQAGAVELAGWAPSVVIGGSVNAEPSAAAVLVSGLVPTVTTSAHVIVSCDVGVATLAGAAPGITAPVTLIPGSGLMVLASERPKILGAGGPKRCPVARRRTGRR